MYHQLFRCLVPSWRFYSGIVSSSRLFLRFESEEDGRTEWVHAWAAPKRKLTAIFLNPQGNLVHAYNTLLHQAEVEVSECRGDVESVERTVSFGLLHRLASKSAAAYAHNHFSGTSSRRFQFAVTSIEPLSQERHTLLESKWYPL